MKTKKIDRDKLKKLISTLRSVANPISAEIISLLEKEKTINVGSINKEIKNRVKKDIIIEQPATSFYLTRLKRMGILISKRKGKEIFYSINREVYDKIVDHIEKVGE